MSLIEMMIAMTISLIVIGAVSGVYLSSSRNYSQDEMLSRMQENARYALHVLAEDLSMAGYWGPVLSDGNIETTGRTCPETEDGDLESYCDGFFADSSLTITTDCGPGTRATAPPIWAYSIDEPIEVSTDQSKFSCIEGFQTAIDGLEVGGVASGSDILVVKRVEGEALSSTRDVDADDDNVFIRTDGSNAMLFVFDNDTDLSSEGSDTFDWRYRSNVYYIRDHFLKDGDGNAADSIPTLVRGQLAGTTMEVEAGGIAQGIEYFHVMFGIDDNGDSTADYYTSSPGLDDLKRATSARIYVLARSVGEDPSYVNDRIYTMGDAVVDLSAEADNDNYFRRVFSTTVVLRNPRNQKAYSGS